MKIFLIHGQSHKGSTYHIGRQLADKLGGEVTEFFLPRDFNKTCIGCTNCFIKGETFCPHYGELHHITEKMDEADVLIFASPVYVYHATGAMKTFLDHYGYRWMVHRPEEKMFCKQAVCISTAAGAGMKSTNKDMADSLFFWGVPKIYQYGVAVQATSYDGIADKTKQKIDRKTTKLAKKIKKTDGRIHVSAKTRIVFHVMRMFQKMGWNESDVNYWNEKGWSAKVRPWKK